MQSASRNVGADLGALTFLLRIIAVMVNALNRGGVEPDLSLAVTPLCRCRFGQTSESAHKNNNSSQADNPNPVS